MPKQIPDQELDAWLAQHELRTMDDLIRYLRQVRTKLGNGEMENRDARAELRNANAAIRRVRSRLMGKLRKPLHHPALDEPG
jgi:hypothetical protein